jgi:hypothetical protein
MVLCWDNFRSRKMVVGGPDGPEIDCKNGKVRALNARLH